MKIVLFSSLKGGTGRTTLSFLLSQYLVHYEGKRVVLLDFDVQNHLSAFVGEKQADFLHRNVPLDTDLEEPLRAAAASGMDVCIIDSHNQVDAFFMYLQGLCDVLVVPFLHSNLDFLKLVGHWTLLHRITDMTAYIYFLPNQFREKGRRGARAAAPLIPENFFSAANPFLLPPVPFLGSIGLNDFNSLSHQSLNIIRPCYRALTHHICHL